MRPDVCVVGACALHAETGVTMREREEALITRALLAAAAGRVVVVAAGDQLVTAGPFVVADVGWVGTVVTDAGAAGEHVAALRERGVEVLVP